MRETRTPSKLIAEAFGGQYIGVRQDTLCSAQRSPTDATFVLVHRSYFGSFRWRWVALCLRAAGHDVYTPSLTGVGERVHLAGPHVDLETHINDVVNVLHTRIYSALS
jgi:pimeloyl-ACP methyl ester carboxylesterase